MKGIFLHVCCAPCAVYPIESLHAENVRVAGFFYNPNVHPSSEYVNRKESVHALAAASGVGIEAGPYDMEAFFRTVGEVSSNRCRACYTLRLDRSAREAKVRGFGSFTTTLLYSRRQKHDLIREAGEETGDRHGVKFEYRDFRSGWQRGVERSKELGLYRQNYCGCVFSEKERFYRNDE